MFFSFFSHPMKYWAPRWFRRFVRIRRIFVGIEKRVFFGMRFLFFFSRCRTRDRAARRSRARIYTSAVCRKIWRNRIWRISSVPTAELSHRGYCATTSPVSLRKSACSIVFASFPRWFICHDNKNFSDRIKFPTCQFLRQREMYYLQTKVSTSRYGYRLKYILVRKYFFQSTYIRFILLFYSRWYEYDEINVRENYI